MQHVSDVVCEVIDQLELAGKIVRRDEGSEPRGFFVLLDSPGGVYRELYEEFLTS